MKISKYAVIGDPISHSLSPQMHNSAFLKLDLPAEYSAIRVKSEELSSFTAKARKELSGFNVTVPHKKAIIPYLDQISEGCQLSESVNTVRVVEGELIGDSTDAYGLEMALNTAFDIKISNNSICFIGCGGVVNAVAFDFAASRAKKIFFINRTIAKAELLSSKLQSRFPDLKLDYCSINDYRKIKDFFRLSTVVIQGSSLGLKETDPPPVDPELLPMDIFLYETIYKRTELLKSAIAQGIKAADGRDMLLYQGAKSFELWTGMVAPVSTMSEALGKALKDTDSTKE